MLWKEHIYDLKETFRLWTKKNAHFAWLSSNSDVTLHNGAVLNLEATIYVQPVSVVSFTQAL